MKAANDNPWYRLATLGDDNHCESVRLWNGYMRYLLEQEYQKDKKASSCHNLIKNLPILNNNDINRIKYIPGLMNYIGGYIDFSNVHFTEHVFFQNFIFPYSVSFMECRFNRTVFFKNCKFYKVASFPSSTFQAGSVFTGAKFHGSAEFFGSEFLGVSCFDNCNFQKKANFSKCFFREVASFENSIFNADADFSASPDTPPHQSKVSFKEATFTRAPAFFERKLHEDTDWSGAKWPRKFNKDGASEDVRRFERLALIMANLKKLDDEHHFFRLSMRAKEVRDGFTLNAIVGYIYGRLFDYGWGFEKALIWWISIILIGAVRLLCETIDVSASFLISFSNVHAFLGLNRGPLKEQYDKVLQEPWFACLWTFQAIIGPILIFFLLLTMRNRFRMR